MEQTQLGLVTEVIDFYKPLENAKNLCITGIVTSTESVESGQIKINLLDAFSRFGLVYETQIICSAMKSQPRKVSSFDNSHHQDMMKRYSTAPTDKESQSTKLQHHEEVENADEHGKYYAFIKFYSSEAAQQAKRYLHLTRIVGSGVCKVNFARRKKLLKSEKDKLPVTHCHDLANFYLGFNGWSTSVLQLKTEDQAVTVDSSMDVVCNGADVKWNGGEQICKCHCVINLSVHQHSLQTLGIGTCREIYTRQSQGQAYARCRKRAFQSAVQNAFSKLLLVLFSNGKIYPEINTSDQQVVIPHPEDCTETSHVQEGSHQPESFPSFIDLDCLNVEILHDLETETVE